MRGRVLGHPEKVKRWPVVKGVEGIAWVAATSCRLMGLALQTELDQRPARRRVPSGRRGRTTWPHAYALAPTS